MEKNKQTKKKTKKKTPNKICFMNILKIFIRAVSVIDIHDHIFFSLLIKNVLITFRVSWIRSCHPFLRWDGGWGGGGVSGGFYCANHSEFICLVSVLPIL